MATALSALSNAQATFNVAAAGVVTDPLTGNVIPAEETVQVQLFLKANKQSGVGFPGVEIVETLFEGYALDALDPRITEGTSGTLTFAGEDALEVEVVSLRLPYGKTGLLGSTLNAALGERIQLRTREQVA